MFWGVFNIVRGLTTAFKMSRQGSPSLGHHSPSAGMVGDIEGMGEESLNDGLGEGAVGGLCGGQGLSHQGPASDPLLLLLEVTQNDG